MTKAAYFIISLVFVCTDVKEQYKSKVLSNQPECYISTHTHLVFLGNKVVYDEHLEPQLSAQLADVLQEALDLSVMLLLQICHLTDKTQQPQWIHLFRSPDQSKLIYQFKLRLKKYFLCLTLHTTPPCCPDRDCFMYGLSQCSSFMLRLLLIWQPSAWSILSSASWSFLEPPPAG